MMDAVGWADEMRVGLLGTTRRVWGETRCEGPAATPAGAGVVLPVAGRRSTAGSALVVLESDHAGIGRTDAGGSDHNRDRSGGTRVGSGTEPPGWEWVWELEAQGPDQTLVTQTYDWSRVTDKELLAKHLFPLVSEDQLEQSLSKVAEIVAS